ncbi:MAG: penicillin-binding protein 1A [Caulobacteraceae bacterium]|nr:penicillin-binding protein 1A [Caulobacteraceae bacterium]
MAQPQKPGPRGPSGKVKRTPLQAVLYWSAVASVWGLIFVAAFFAVFAVDLPDTSKLYEVDRQPSISYLDRSGALVAVRGSQYAPPANLDELPDYVPKAFIAIEDRWFYWHFGFNPWGIIRSQIYNMTADGGPLRGGSTITQQLARNLFLTADQTYRRKAQELILAIWLELKFSKKEILELYLNRVYFGGGAYGIEAASQRYFNKPASQLTIGESALLAGLMKGPSRYSPVSATDRAARRATIVLDEMVRIGAITPEQRTEAFNNPVRVNPTLANQRAQYFVDWVDDQVRALVGEPTDDLVVETTLDLPIQTAAEQAIRRGVAAGADQGIGQGALVALDGGGRVRAYVGGADYEESQFDRATLARRQAGSAFKPFVYLSAMEQGRSPNVRVVDEPLRIGDWEPSNYTNDFRGEMTLQQALALSTNTVAARLASEVGTGNVAATAKRLGITGRIQLDPSMALGAVEVTPLQMAQAYAPFANGGFKATGYGIERIRTADGRVLYDHNVDKPDRQSVIGSPALQYMNQMMRQVVAGGTGTAARVPNYDLAGKTGTTNDYKDAWFVGYTGGFVAAVWVGKDDNTAMRRVSGGGAPARIWKDFMSSALPRLNAQPIPGGTIDPPPVEAPVDPIGDLLDGVGGMISPDPAPTPAPAPAGTESIPY